MSFNELDVKELIAVAEYYGVDYEDGAEPEDIATAIEADGVEFEDWERLKAEAAKELERAEPEQPAVTGKKKGRPPLKKQPTAKDVVSGGVLLIKMTRQNPTYEVNGFKFTKDHPYVAMSPEEYQDILDIEGEGFIQASPRELQEYYS